MRLRLPFLSPRPPVVSVVRLSGVIASGARGRLSDESVAPLLEKAFRKGKPQAVALLLNSPGGSPVQSSLIASRIRRLSEEKSIPVHAFVEDVAASGGYWLAAAADRIWVDAASIVGSIGVISSSFGLQTFIARQGIERRVHTAGESKSWLDPFQPEKPEDVERLKVLQEQIHGLFIDHVKARRPNLSSGTPLFTGDVWVGERAVDVGLVDGVAHLVPKMKELVGENVRFRSYGPKRGILARLGRTAVTTAVDAIEEQVAFARFGL